MSDVFSGLGNPYYKTPVPVAGMASGIVQRFGFSCHSIGWDNPLCNEPLGMDNGQVFFPRYGSAMVGSERTIRLGVPQAGDSFVMFRGPTTMLAGVLRLPYIENPKKAGAQIHRYSQRRFRAITKKKKLDEIDMRAIPRDEPDEDVELDMEDSPPETEAVQKKRRMSEINPWDYEVAHIARSLERLCTRPYDCESCIVFMGGNSANDVWGLPPAQVSAVLGALAAGGFMTRTIRMFMPGGEVHDEAELFFDPNDGRVMYDSQFVARTSPSKEKHILSVLTTMEKASKSFTTHGKKIQRIAVDYLIQTAVGLWGTTPWRVDMRLTEVTTELADVHATQRKWIIADRYCEWRGQVPQLRNP